MENINEILDSKEFNEMFDLEQERKEIEEAGWTYKEIEAFAKGMVKQIEKK